MQSVLYPRTSEDLARTSARVASAPRVFCRALVSTSSRRSFFYQPPEPSSLVARSILYTSRRGFKRGETFQTGGSLISAVTSRKEVLVTAMLLRHVERYFTCAWRDIFFIVNHYARSPSVRYEKRYVFADNLAARRGHTRD